jgi:hypothetical protein
MTDANPTRPNYIDGQFLDADDFTIEQRYHLSMLRRHHIAHHTAGTVTGLEIGIDGDTRIPYVGPGVGIDAFGRELIVTERLSLGSNLFAPGGGDAYNVMLHYGREAADGPTATRWVEEPSVDLVAPTGPGAGPPTPTGVVANFDPVDDPPDDPAQEAPLFLGQLRRPDTPGADPIIDESGRPYVELHASAVTAAERTARLELASADGALALYAGSDPSQHRRRFAVTADGGLIADDGMVVGGALTVGGNLTFEPGSAATGWGVQLVSAANSVTELRIQMGPASGSQPRKTVIGVSQGGSFKPLLTIADDGSVTVSGDMIVTGQLDPQGGIVPAALSSQAAQYAAASMSSGIGATAGLIEKLQSGAFAPLAPNPPSAAASVKQAARQLVDHLQEDVSHAEAFAEEVKDKGEGFVQHLIDALRKV